MLKLSHFSDIAYKTQLNGTDAEYK